MLLYIGLRSIERLMYLSFAVRRCESEREKELFLREKIICAGKRNTTYKGREQEASDRERERAQEIEIQGRST